MKSYLGKYQTAIYETIDDLNEQKIINRIWKKEHTVWRDVPTEISNRLGWLDCIEVTRESFPEIKDFAEEIKNEGFTSALLMGMGGSSLAPEVFRLTFGVKHSHLDLLVLDSTHPERILELSKKLNPEKTLYIVSTKSGGTIETISFMKYFYTDIVKKLGRERAGANFIAITDPGSGLETKAKELNFRKIFLNDPNIGGRFSALSLFGAIPATLIGTDLEKLFSKASVMVDESKRYDIRDNSSAMLGAIIGTLACEGVDKLTIICSPQIQYFGAWLEQLIAESTGKDGKGILPVDLEIVNIPENYSSDRTFIYLKLNKDLTFDKKVKELISSGLSVIELELTDVYDLGGEFFRWEFATAVAGYVLGVQPFDQPNVESAKVAARSMMKQYSETGTLHSLKPEFIEDEIKVSGDVNAGNLKGVLSEFLSVTEKGKSYVALQAYLKPGAELWQSLQVLRLKIFSKYKVATTLGYGPRFLHSTGQLHKGDAGNGLFIQLVADYENDVPIPDEAGVESTSISFSTLINAQALGDRKALIEGGRKVLQFHLGKNIISSIAKLSNLI